MAEDIHRELPFASRNRCFDYILKSKLATFRLSTHRAYVCLLKTIFMLLFDSCTLRRFI